MSIEGGVPSQAEPSPQEREWLDAYLEAAIRVKIHEDSKAAEAIAAFAAAMKGADRSVMTAWIENQSATVAEVAGNAAGGEAASAEQTASVADTEAEKADYDALADLLVNDARETPKESDPELWQALQILDDDEVKRLAYEFVAEHIGDPSYFEDDPAQEDSYP
jgi:hypothetical protein